MKDGLGEPDADALEKQRTELRPVLQAKKLGQRDLVRISKYELKGYMEGAVEN